MSGETMTLYALRVQQSPSTLAATSGPGGSWNVRWGQFHGGRQISDEVPATRCDPVLRSQSRAVIQAPDPGIAHAVPDSRRLKWDLLRVG